MSDITNPYVDCNCDTLSRRDYEDERGVYRFCVNCGRVFRMAANGPDDFDWEDTDEYKEV